MGKKDKKSVAAKAAKKAKAASKAEKKNVKSIKKDKKGKKEEVEDEEDLIQTLEDFRRKWEEEHKMTQEIVEGPPTRRANATLTPCPLSDHLWLFGGEYFDGDKCYFYNDLYRYAPDKNEWKKFTSPTCPGPRSAHQIAPMASQGGKLWLFGGEFASFNQTSFHHWRDLWSFDITSHAWERYETKIRPSARSGHRMAVWKQWIVLYGGFHDVGIRTNYLQDLWVWDTMEYKWQQVMFKETDRRPSARSGFSFLPCAEGVILHGGYCKEYSGKKATGIALDDTWLLRMDADLTQVKWEKRRRGGYSPCRRSGSTMALWGSKGMGIMFGGVVDTEEDEESLESVFFNDLHGYLMTGNGRWVSMNLKKPKKKGGGGRRKKAIVLEKVDEEDDSDDGGEKEEGT
ncbi:galactose oxidase, partial [Atractiella rhizophila]